MDGILPVLAGGAGELLTGEVVDLKESAIWLDVIPVFIGVCAGARLEAG